MSIRSHRTALAGRQHGAGIGRGAGASRHVTPRERPLRSCLNALREILAFLRTGGDEGHAANRYRS